MKNERAINRYVVAERAHRCVVAQDPADMVNYERHLKLAHDAVWSAYRALNGGQLAEARRRLAATP